jgi:hypothetical protein
MLNEAVTFGPPPREINPWFRTSRCLVAKQAAAPFRSGVSKTLCGTAQGYLTFPSNDSGIASDRTDSRNQYFSFKLAGV